MKRYSVPVNMTIEVEDGYDGTYAQAVVHALLGELLDVESQSPDGTAFVGFAIGNASEES